MKLGQARLLTVVLAAIGLVLFPLGVVLGNMVLFYGGLLCYVLMMLVWFWFNRCPHCHKHLGRSTGIYCPRCGEKL